ncbi:ABC transporter substrate-binding protein [Paucibacter sp. DJ1R-11]|uniref:ABC transporter substrate-binding protein n=1 Tax=Paucibacter sp. DJ1R-11 TaxID=2893556 RepID=UPI0021E3FC77|nr:ABC transporter substrate-binding protein [Paucibacter sp. DJ1R-11]MCV2362522.1 ABC transporter substrate-binding protein [Paucibacter sp. DJ1R-11]
MLRNRVLCLLLAGLAGLAGLTAAPCLAQGAATEPPAKVLRYAFRIAETGFDPAQISDLYSRIVAAGIFEAPLQYEYLARPLRLRTATAAELPEIAADFKTLTFRIKPGIYFNDDPAFEGLKPGEKRELTAADYIYSIKRHFDPRWKSPNLYLLENARLPGLSELRREALEQRKPFDYERPVAGLRQLDRYTFQVRTEAADPRFVHQFADPSVMGAVAREVVERYGDKIMEHPVGTGAFALTEWRRSSRMVLEKNPNFRELRYDEQPPADSEARLKAQAARLQGRRLPMIDRVEIAIIEENQPRWLSFLRGEFDLVDEVPAEYAPIAFPNNKLAPNLAKLGMQMVRYPRADVAISYFNMEDPVVGGYTPDKVALRRAISLAIDIDKEIRLPRRGQAMAAQGPISPGVFGYEPTLKTTMSEHDLARARALLDLYGYVDRDGDGWREQPDGSALTIEYATEQDGEKRALAELWQKAMDAIQIRIKFRHAKWPENLKASTAGKLMMWGVGWSAAAPDGDTFLSLGYGPNKSQSNKARFDLPAYNALYEQQKALANGPERLALMTEAQKLIVAYMPIKMHVHRVYTDLAQPWVSGYKRNVFVRDFWKYIDIDAEAAQASPKADGKK